MIAYKRPADLQHARHPFYNDGIIMLLAALASLLLSWWLIYSTDTLNKDAILYLRMAQLIKDGDWHAAMQLYDMVLLPALIAAISSLSGLSLSAAGYSLMAVLYAAIAVVMTRLVRATGGSQTHQWIVVAALLSHQTLNQYREIIIRDPGAWLFSLLAVLDFLRWRSQPRALYLGGFIAATLIAGFWRLEALCLLLLPPITAVCRREYSLSRTLLPLCLVIIAAACVATAFYFINDKQLWQGLHVQLYSAQLAGLPQNFEHARELITQQLLLTNSSPQVSVAAASIYITALLMNLIDAIGPMLCLVLVICTHMTRTPPQAQVPSTDFQLILKIVFVIGASYLFVLLLTLKFLVPRYAMLIGLLTLVTIPFAVQRAIDSAGTRQQRNRRILLIATLLTLALLDGAISTGPGKYNARDAAAWVHDHLPHDNCLVTNSHHIAWESRMQIDWDLVNQLDRTLDSKQVRNTHCHYYALAINRRDGHLIKLMSEALKDKPAQIFDQHPGAIVFVYSTTHQ